MRVIREVLSWLIPIAIGLVVAGLIQRFVFSMVRVDGPSMEPNLINNERVAVVKTASVKHLSVIVFNAYHVDPDATVKDVKYVKRVIGMPGDTVSSDNGQITVNGHQIKQNFISNYERTQGTGNWNLQSISNRNGWVTSTTKVPKGYYFVLGDHRSVSNDSRYWGFVPKKKVFGVVKVPFWDTDKTKRHNINSLAY